MLDAEIASALNKIIQNSSLKKISLEECSERGSVPLAPTIQVIGEDRAPGLGL